MRIYKDLSEVSYDKKSIITIGTFDGIHLGHKKIINEVVRKASDLGGRSFVITFHPHPRKIILGDNQIKLLSTPDEKIKILEELNVENLLTINFSKEFSQLSPEKFIDDYIINGIGVSEIVLGYDHHFGKGRGGDINFLREKGKVAGFEVTAIEACTLDNIKISSSKVRQAITEGHISLANTFIGRYYSFSGKVVEGDKRGRELGFPTANLKIENGDKLLPVIGIYAIELFVNGRKHLGLLSIGRRPTFYTSGEIVPEVYIFDFSGNIYGETVNVRVVERIRGEEKFSSADELIKQMNDDKKTGREILNKLNN